MERQNPTIVKIYRRRNRPGSAGCGVAPRIGAAAKMVASGGKTP